jgi:hypothetical protein
VKIYIPTLARTDNQITLHNLPNLVLEDVVLVVDKKDRIPFGGASTILTCPAHGIGKVRQWIIDNHDVKKYGRSLLMLDDDLSFAVRRKDDPTKFLPSTAADVIAMLNETADMAQEYAHGGILSREGGNRVLSNYKENSRNLRALFYDVTIMRKLDIRFDRIPVMEDFDVALQLLRAGYQSITVARYVQDQIRSNAPGGCSTYRTREVQRKGALGLQKLHPQFVKTVEKTTKTAWNGETRTDVMVQWKKAYESSQR